MDGNTANPLLGRALIQVSDAYDPFDHYDLNKGPTDEFGDLPEAPPTIRNWATTALTAARTATA